MTQAMSKTEPRALSAVPTPPTQTVLATDIVVPSLYLMQGLSQAVVDKKADIGNIIRSTTLETVAGPDKTINFVPLRMTTTWIEKECIGNKGGKDKFEYRRTVPRTAKNERSDWNFYRDANGKESPEPFLGATKWMRTKTINVYALLVDDVTGYNAEIKKAVESGEMPDLTKSLLPVCIQFRNTSFKAGQNVANFYMQFEDMRKYNAALKSYSYMMPLSCKKEENDDGTFYVYQVGGAKKLDDTLLPQAELWYNRLGSSDVKVDESGLDETSGRATEQSQF